MRKMKQDKEKRLTRNRSDRVGGGEGGGLEQFPLRILRDIVYDCSRIEAELSDNDDRVEPASDLWLFAVDLVRFVGDKRWECGTRADFT